MRRVALTGCGIVVAGARADAAGLEPLWIDDERELQSRVRLPDRKRAKLMAPDVLSSHLAAERALAEAGLAELEAERTGIFVGTRLSARMHPQLADTLARCGAAPPPDPGRWFQEVSSRLNPVHQLMYLSNRIALHLSISYGVRGPVRTFGGSACASACAILQGFESIRFAEVDAALVGGADLGRDAFGCLLERVAGGDSERGAACFLVLEEGERAQRRGARVQGWLLDGACPVGADDEASAIEAAVAAALRRSDLEREAASLPRIAPPAWIPPGNARAPAALAAALRAAASPPHPRRAVAASGDRDLGAGAFAVEAA